MLPLEVVAEPELSPLVVPEDEPVLELLGWVLVAGWTPAVDEDGLAVGDWVLDGGWALEDGLLEAVPAVDAWQVQLVPDGDVDVPDDSGDDDCDMTNGMPLGW